MHVCTRFADLLSHLPGSHYPFYLSSSLWNRPKPDYALIRILTLLLLLLLLLIRNLTIALRTLLHIVRLLRVLCIWLL